MAKYKSLIVSLLCALGVGGLSALLTSDSMGQYQQLAQPPLAPPGWLFPVVWTLLFILMGISAWLVWRSPARERRAALTVYAVQLAMNLGWSLLFFRAQLRLPAFFWLVALEILLGVMIALFARCDRRAALLQIPYFCWVLFAGYLYLGVWALNK